MTDREKKAKEFVGYKIKHDNEWKREELITIRSLFDEVERLREELEACRDANTQKKKQISDLQAKLSELEKGRMTDKEIEEILNNPPNGKGLPDWEVVGSDKLAKALSGHIGMGREKLIKRLKDLDNEAEHFVVIGLYEDLADAILKG